MPAMVLGVVQDVTLAAASAVNELTGLMGARWLILWSSDVDVYLVTKSGGTAAADGRLIPDASMDGGYPIDIGPYGFVGLAGSAAGTVRVEIR